MAAAARLEPDQIRPWRETLIGLSASDAGRKALRPLGDIKIRDFVAYDPAIEDFTRNLMQYSPAP